MSNKKTPQSTITKSRIASSKWLQLLCAILTLALDVVVLLVLLVNTTEIKYIVCPILLLVLDLVFIVKVLLSNYRFMYAIGGVLIHVACIILACGGAFLASGALGDRVVFETLALIALPAVHLLQCIAALCNAWQAIRRGKPVRRIVALVVSALLVVGIGLYVNFLRVNGFFGQGAERTERTVVYVLDASGSYYIAVDVLEGKGNTVTIPAEFNGLPVKGVDCALFGNDEISYMVFAGSADLEFLNTASLAHVNENLGLEVDKANVDEFRNEFYALARENPQMLYVANHIKPIGLKTGDVYVIPRYDKDALELANGQILPTWFGSAGDVINVREDLQFATCDYVRYSDITDESHLYWSYVNQKEQIFRWLKDAEGNDLSGTAIGASTDAYVSFDRVYAINFGAGNDTLHTLDASYTGIRVDGEYVEYKLATADRAAEVVARIPTRNGFTLTWLAGPDRHNLTDMQAEIQSLSRGESLNVYPEWKLNMPTIDSLTADGVSEGHSAIYGEDVSLAVQATPPHESISLKYEWILNEVLGQEKTYIIQNLHPEDAKTYTVRVTAYADTSSLTATVEKTVEVGFEKRELHFVWKLPENLVYEAGNKPVSVEGEDPINGDSVSVRLSRDSVKDVGEYTITLELYGDTATKYKIAESDVSQTVVVTPYPLSVKWSDDRAFVYDGTEQHPGASVQALGSDTVSLSFAGGQKNAGTGYRVTVTSDNPNYTLTGNETAFEIKQRPITGIEWIEQSSFKYNASQRVRTVNRFEGCVPADRDMLITSVIYSGHQVNVGENYTVSVSLPEGSNYYFAEECNIQSTFAITPQELKVKMNKAQKVYDGMAYTDFSYSVVGLQGTDQENEIFTVTEYVGEGIGVVNVRTQPYAFSANIEQSGEKASNYTIEVVGGTLTITKKDLNLVINNQSKPYDGYVYPEYNFTFTPKGLVSADENDIDSILFLTYTGEALEEIDAGSWIIDAVEQPVNAEKYGNYNVCVVTGTLTINRAKATVTAIVSGNGKTYDALPYTEFDFKVMGLVGDDKEWMLGDPIFGGAATNNPNATTTGHTLTVRLPSNDVTNNYDFTYEDADAIILKKSVTVTALDGTKVYDGTTAYTQYVDFDVEGVIDADRGRIGSPRYAVDVADQNAIRNAGEYVLKVTLPTLENTGNYEITYKNGTLTVTPKKVTVTLSSSLKKAYNAKQTTAADFASAYSVNGLVSGDSLGSAEFGGDAVGALNAGTYTLTLEFSGNPNYDIQPITPVTYTISKRALTVSLNDLDRPYDGTEGYDFASAYSVSGLIGSDGEALLGDPIYSGTAVTARNAGTYDWYLSFTNTVLDNYTLNINNNRAGKLTIGKAKLTVTVKAKEKEYDGIPLVLDYEITGLVGGDTWNLPADPWAVYNVENGTAVSPDNVVNAGKYFVEFNSHVSGKLDNYTLNLIGADCTITKKAVTVTVDDIPDKTYDGEAVTGFSYTVVGLVSGEQLQQPRWTVNGSSSNQAINAGEYTVNAVFAPQTNYKVSVRPATFKITKKTVEVTVNDVPDKTYDGEAVTGFGYTVDGLVGGDRLGQPQWLVNDSATTKAINAGEYTVNAGFASQTNYEIKVRPATFTITKRLVTVSAIAPDRDYDGTTGGEFFFTMGNLAAGDRKNDFEAIFGGSALDAKDPGTYTLTVRIKDSAKTQNYEFDYVSNDFVIREVETEPETETDVVTPPENQG